MRRQTSSLYPPFVRLVVSTVVPLCVGPPTRLRTAVEGHYSSAPGALAQVRVIVSRSVVIVQVAATSVNARSHAPRQTLTERVFESVLSVAVAERQSPLHGRDGAARDRPQVLRRSSFHRLGTASQPSCARALYQFLWRPKAVRNIFSPGWSDTQGLVDPQRDDTTSTPRRRSAARLQLGARPDKGCDGHLLQVSRLRRPLRG